MLYYNKIHERPTALQKQPATTRTVGPFWTAEHDHQRCVRQALSRAEQLCRRRGQRLTPLRRRILEMVWISHRPIGAYAILDRLRRERGRSAPPTVYRALDFLQEQGLVHRLASLNAYAGCTRPDRPHTGQFLICASCQSLAELDDPQVVAAISESAAAAGFVVRHPTVEVLGLCPACRQEQS